ncbi:MAG: hypothetical protein ACREO1_01080 [Arenimonas sp.]
MKRLMLAPLLIALASLTACYQEAEPDVVTVPATPDTVVVPADPVVVPVPTPVPGPPGEKGEKGDTGDKGETGDTVVPIIVEDKDDQTTDEGDRKN